MSTPRVYRVRRPERARYRRRNPYTVKPCTYCVFFPDITYPDFASFLPAEISSHIFSYIDERTLLTSCPLVSKQWKELSSSSYVWRRAFINKLGFWNGPRHAEWKKMYAALAQVDMNWNSRKTEDYNYLKGHKDSVYCVQFDE